MLSVYGRERAGSRWRQYKYGNQPVCLMLSHFHWKFHVLGNLNPCKTETVGPLTNGFTENTGDAVTAPLRPPLLG